MILTELRRRFEAIYGDRLLHLYLFSSCARGDARPGSDVDVLVVLDRIGAHEEEIKRTSQARADLSLEYDVNIRLAYISEEEWRGQEEPFLSRVLREGRVAESADASPEE